MTCLLNQVKCQDILIRDETEGVGVRGGEFLTYIEYKVANLLIELMPAG